MTDHCRMSLRHSSGLLLTVPVTSHDQQVGGIFNSDDLSADELTAIRQLTALKTCVSRARQVHSNPSEPTNTTMRMIAGSSTGAGPLLSPPLLLSPEHRRPSANDRWFGKSSLQPLQLSTGEPPTDVDTGLATLDGPARQEPSKTELIRMPSTSREQASNLEDFPRKSSGRMNAAQKHILKQHFVRDKKPRKDTFEKIALEIDQLDGGKHVTARVCGREGGREGEREGGREGTESVHSGQSREEGGR